MLFHYFKLILIYFKCKVNTLCNWSTNLNIESIICCNLNCKEIVTPITAGVVLCALYTLKNQLRMLYFYLWIIAQIVLESLPISSSGHVLLLEKLLSLSFFDTHGLLGSGSLYQKISFFIHAPSALIIAVFFYKDWFFLLKNIKIMYPLVLRLCGYVVIANVITVLLYGVKHYLKLDAALFLPYGFTITMLLLFSLYYVRDSAQSMTWKKAIVIGCVQGCALMPGISRFAATYVAARWLGLSARRGMQLSFAIQFPLIALASVYGFFTMPAVAWDALFSVPALTIIFGAMSIAYALLQGAYYLACNHKLQWFAWYMILPILLSLMIG